MEKNALLQRRQRIDILHIRHPSSHPGRYPVYLSLTQLHQRQQLRRDVLAAFRYQIRRHLHRSSPAACSLCQRSQRRSRKNRTHIHTQTHTAHALDQRYRDQRVPSQREKVVLPSHSFQLQQLRPDPRQLPLDLSLRRLIPLPRIGILLRRRQRLAVQLPVRRQRHPLHPHIRRRYHVLRQHLRQMHPQLRCIGHGVVVRSVVGDQSLVSRRVLPRNHHRLPHLLLFHQPRFDLSQLNPVSPYLHLIIVPPHKLDVPVPAPPPQISRPVHPCSRFPAEPVRHKPLRRQFLTVQISPRYSRSSDVHLPCHSRWHRLPIPIQDVNLRVRYRPPHRYRPPILHASRDVIRRTSDYSFRRPVFVDELRNRHQ